MPINIKDLNPGEWFEYPSDDGYAGEVEKVKLRAPDLEAIKRIDAQTATKEVEHVQPRKKNGKIDRRQSLQRIEYVVYDDEKKEALVFDFMIVDWNLKTPEGIDIPCTTENKVKLLLGSREFNRFVTECCETLTEENEKREKDLEKNLSRSAPGMQAKIDPEKE